MSRVSCSCSCGGLLASRRDLRVELGGEHLRAGVVQRVDRSRLGELAGEHGARVGARLGRGKRGQGLARGDGADIGLPRVGGEAQGLLRGAKLGLLDADTRDLRACRPGRERKDAGDHLPLDVELDRGRDIVEGEDRQRWPARLHRDRLGDAEPVIGGLQPGIVEERDLHRGIGAERRAQQTRDFAPRERGILGGADPHHVFVQASAGDRRHRAHPTVGREGLAG